MRHLDTTGLLLLLLVTAPTVAEEAPTVSTAPSVAATAAERWERRIGEARSLADGRVLYREEHLLQRDAQGEPSQRLVLYRCPDGAAFGRKTLTYGDNPVVPTFRMEDARWGYVEQLEAGPEGLTISVQRPGEAPQTGVIAVDDANLVADAGYDEFVRRRWDELSTGDKVRLDFVVPSRLTYYGFAVQKQREERVDDSAVKVFSLGLSGFFGMFLPKIEVAYDAETRELRRFVGLTNIRDVEGDNVEARINFPRGSEAIDAARASQAATEPLSGRCS